MRSVKQRILEKYLIDQQAAKQDPVSVRVALGLPEVREMIISKTKDPGQNNTFDLRLLLSLRLVSKEWLTSVQTVLRKHGQPLFELVLGDTNTYDYNFLSNSYRIRVDEFISVVCKAEWNRECLPTFSLIIGEDYFNGDSYKYFRNCLRKYGKGLVELKILVDNVVYLPDKMFFSLNLPWLHKLEIQETSFLKRPDQENTRIVNMTKGLLDSSGKLKKLRLQVENEIFDHIVFPEYLSELEFPSELSNRQIESLTQNKFSSLGSLIITIPQVPFSNGLMFTLLDTVKVTLHTLEFDSGDFHEHNLTPTLIGFPVMEKLTNLVFHGAGCQIEPTTLKTSLDVRFPNLKSLSLRQTEQGFRLWTQNSKFPKVSNLKLRIVNVQDLYFSETTSINLENMWLSHIAFPNVKQLELNLRGNDTSGLEYLFQNTKKLEVLHINIDKVETFQNMDYWDALLTGTTIDVIQQHRLISKSGRSTFIEENQTRPSIRNLTNLNSLRLHDMDFIGCDQRSLISDLSFSFGFLKMSNLKHVELWGRFKPAGYSRTTCLTNMEHFRNF